MKQRLCPHATLRVSASSPRCTPWASPHNACGTAGMQLSFMHSGTVAQWHSGTDYKRNGAEPCRRTVRCCGVVWCAVLYCAGLRCAALGCAVLCCAVLYCAGLRCAALGCASTRTCWGRCDAYTPGATLPYMTWGSQSHQAASAVLPPPPCQNNSKAPKVAGTTAGCCLLASEPRCDHQSSSLTNPPYQASAGLPIKYDPPKHAQTHTHTLHNCGCPYTHTHTHTNCSVVAQRA